MPNRSQSAVVVISADHGGIVADGHGAAEAVISGGANGNARNNVGAIPCGCLIKGIS